ESRSRLGLVAFELVFGDESMKGFARLMAVSLAGSAAHAQGSQDAERASFYVASPTAIGPPATEIVQRRRHWRGQLTGAFSDRSAGGRVMYKATIDTNDLIIRLTTRSFRGASDTVGETNQFTLGGDSIVVVRGRAAPAHVPGVPGTLVIVNPSV